MLSLQLVILSLLLTASHQLYIGEDGGYRDIVVKIDNKLEDDNCPLVLARIKVGYYCDHALE